MANPWCRLWADMPNDPKWRTIARVSRQRIGDVIAVYVHLMVCASNADERGQTQSFVCEDVATALDLEEENVTAILSAMQGRVLNGERLAGWEKRQPLREDGSAERGKEYRERQKAEKERLKAEGEQNQTQPNAQKRPDTDKDTDTEEKITTKARSRAEANATATRLPADWAASAEDIEFCKTERPELIPAQTEQRFRDYWIAQPGVKGRKADWPATWRNWVRNERAPHGAVAGRPAKFDPTAFVNRGRPQPGSST